MYLTTILAFFHIIFAVIWLGGAVLNTVVLLPLTKIWSSSTKKEFLSTFIPKIVPYMMISSILTLLFGFLLAYNMSNGNIHSILFHINSWDSYIEIGASLGLIAFVIGEIIIVPIGLKFASLTGKLTEEGKDPSSSPQVMGLQKKLDGTTFVGLIFLILTLIIMVSAGFS
jgi:uncharacterized membrane protein